MQQKNIRNKISNYLNENIYIDLNQYVDLSEVSFVRASLEIYLNSRLLNIGTHIRSNVKL